MYVNYNSKSSNVQYNYTESKAKGKTEKNVNVEVNFHSVSMKAVMDTDVLSLSEESSKSVKSKDSFRQSLIDVMEKIKNHAEDSFRRQTETVMAEIQSFSISIKISMTSETIKDTEKAVSDLTAEDGYFGVKKTSQRIFDFAAGIAGNDLEKLKQAKEGIEKGFRIVKDAFGENLPDITDKTYKAVMEKMDSYMEHLAVSQEKAYA